jgi:heme-degrading monooxygenase HmoA
MQLGKPARAGAVSLTWMDARDADEALQVATLTRDDVLPELAAMPGFLSTVPAHAGSRLVTISAWEDAEAPRRLLTSDGHRRAMGHFFRRNLGTAVHTAVWTAHHLNPLWVRCPGCEEVAGYDTGQGVCSCGHPLPQVPAW